MKIQPNQPQTGEDTAPKGAAKDTKEAGGKVFESLMDGKQGKLPGTPGTPGKNSAPGAPGKNSSGPGAPGPTLQQGKELKGTGTPGTTSLHGGQEVSEAGKKADETLSGKSFKNTLDKQESSEIGGGTPGSQGFPLATYLEPPPPKNIEAIQHGGLNVQEIEKLVDNVMVGVSETGDPQFKMDMHVNSLGPVNIQITRTEQGLQIHFNAETEKAGLQLGQNLSVLQETLAAKGLQVSNIQLMVGNEPLAMNQLLDAPRPGAQERVHRKDRVQKASAEKPSKPMPKGR